MESRGCRRTRIIIVLWLLSSMVISCSQAFTSTSTSSSSSDRVRVHRPSLSARRPYSRTTTSSSSAAAAAQSDNNENVDDIHNYDQEETLLKLKIQGTDLETLTRFCQSFPFSAVLPVQPLMYLPIYNTDNENNDNAAAGVHVKFLRKKTAEKSSMDGGIRFFVTKEDDSTMLEITAKRNSHGQSVPKMFAEKLVVTNFVQTLAGEDSQYGMSIPGATIVSVFHKWMDGGNTGGGLLDINTQQQPEE